MVSMSELVRHLREAAESLERQADHYRRLAEALREAAAVAADGAPEESQPTSKPKPTSQPTSKPKPSDIHPVELGILEYLARHGEGRAKDLHAHAAADGASATVDYWRRRLTDQGVIQRVRWGVYGLTDQGQRYVQELELCPT